LLVREFSPSDFTPIEEFPLAWRWAAPHDALPPDVLAEIRPLHPGAAAALGSEAAARCASAPVWEYAETFQAEWDVEEPVAKDLLALGIGPEARVVVSWDARTAVVTRWGVFARHWGAFCYPSSDDVTVWAPGDGWTLCYRHFQIFQFRRAAPAG
jgi:hypothetical protein